MFTIDDLWRIMKYLKDGTTDPNLSELTTTLATSEKEITNTYFDQIIDQPTFTSNDYRMLRQMIIDWYASHKTIATTQKNVSDVHQLPNDHLSELFKSFGFPIGLDLVPLTSKANFFLDLLNFYKKKGTPETLVDVLDYYGFSDTDLIEYWLQKDAYGNLIFRGESVRLAATGSTLLLDSDVSYEKITSTDPHWFQTKDQILEMVGNKKVNLPSKTPYFSLSSIFSLYTINISLSILFRVVEDQHERYILGLELPENVLVKNLGLILPILHVYVGTIYAYERMFGPGVETNYDQYNCYNGPLTYSTDDPPIPQNLSDITTEYETLISTPTSRSDRDAKLIQLIDDWSRPLSSTFLNSINAAAPLLENLNPDFKDVIDSWFDTDNQSYLITYLIGTLDNWIRLNIDSKSPSLVITMLGIGFRDELANIINFFKPYRARLAFMDTAFSIKNPLTESVLLDDWLKTQIEQSHRDVIRPLNFNGDPCNYEFFGGSGPAPPVPVPIPEGYAGYYSKFLWDLGGIFDAPPLDQMDEDYMERFNKYLQSLLIGSICDRVITRIELNFKEILGVSFPRGNYDSGDFYDVDADTATDAHDAGIVIKQWQDSFTYDIDIGERGMGDDVPVIDGPITGIETTTVDTFGMEPPVMMDVGSSYDTLNPKAAVRDTFHIDISSLGFSNSSTNVTGTISSGGPELMTSSANMSTLIFNTELTLGMAESLSSSNAIISVTVSVPLLIGLNYYFDNDGSFDTPPKAT